MIYDQADYFRLPLLDGRFGVGQIFEKDAGGSGIVFCGLSQRSVGAAEPITPFASSEVIAVIRVPDTAITSEQWPLAGFDQLPRFRDFVAYDANAALGFPDHPVHDPAVIEGFINAVHGHYPWDAFGPLFDQIKRADMDKPKAAT